jgi:5'(3')-deoxyribonucleotidase
MMERIWQFKQQLLAENKQGIALDVDDTLSVTIEYWIARMFMELGNPENYTVDYILKNHRDCPGDKFWQTEDRMKFIDKCVYSSEFQEELPLIENANEIVKRINLEVPILAYITARPELVVRGTGNWLQRHDFPKAELIARPDDLEKGTNSKWKAQVLEILYPQVQGIVDDNSGLIDALSPNYKGTVYLYKNTYFNETGVKVVLCKNWEEVGNAVLNKKV